MANHPASLLAAAPPDQHVAPPFHQDFSTVVVMRHAERQDEVDEEWASREAARGGRPHDPPLSANGMQQAADTGQRLAADGLRIGAIVVSPFLRLRGSRGCTM